MFDRVEDCHHISSLTLLLMKVPPMSQASETLLSTSAPSINAEITTAVRNWSQHRRSGFDQFVFSHALLAQEVQFTKETPTLQANAQLKNDL